MPVALCPDGIKNGPAPPCPGSSSAVTPVGQCACKCAASAAKIFAGFWAATNRQVIFARASAGCTVLSQSPAIHLSARSHPALAAPIAVRVSYIRARQTPQALRFPPDTRLLHKVSAQPPPGPPRSAARHRHKTLRPSPSHPPTSSRPTDAPKPSPDWQSRRHAGPSVDPTVAPAPRSRPSPTPSTPQQSAADPAHIAAHPPRKSYPPSTVLRSPQQKAANQGSRSPPAPQRKTSHSPADAQQFSAASPPPRSAPTCRPCHLKPRAPRPCHSAPRVQRAGCPTDQTARQAAHRNAHRSGSSAYRPPRAANVRRPPDAHLSATPLPPQPLPPSTTAPPTPQRAPHPGYSRAWLTRIESAQMPIIPAQTAPAPSPDTAAKPSTSPAIAPKGWTISNRQANPRCGRIFLCR